MDFNTCYIAEAARRSNIRDQVDSPRRMESFLKLCGFSKAQAKAITSGGWRAYEGAAAQDDPGDQDHEGGDTPDDALADWLRQAAAKHARQ